MAKSENAFAVSMQTRKRIKLKSILRKMNRIAMGQEKATTQQMRAMEILLKKTMPDLSAIAVTDEEGKGLQTVMNINLGGKSE